MYECMYACVYTVSQFDLLRLGDVPYNADTKLVLKLKARYECGYYNL